MLSIQNHERQTYLESKIQWTIQRQCLNALTKQKQKQKKRDKLQQNYKTRITVKYFPWMRDDSTEQQNSETEIIMKGRSSKILSCHLPFQGSKDLREP